MKITNQLQLDEYLAKFQTAFDRIRRSSRLSRDETRT
jgi:hypothetical protein